MPIVNAKVEIWKDGVLIDTLYTDSQGKARKTLDVGAYSIIISKTGYNTITKNETISTRTELLVNLPEAIALGATELLLGISCAKDYSTNYTSVPISITSTYETDVA